MKPKYSCDGKLCIVSYQDSIDSQFCQRHSLIAREYLAENDCFILDLKNVSFIDSAGIGRLVGAYRSLDSQGKALCLVNICSNIRKVLHISKIESVFTIFDSLQEAKLYYKNVSTSL